MCSKKNEGFGGFSKWEGFGIGVTGNVEEE